MERSKKKEVEKKDGKKKDSKKKDDNCYKFSWEILGYDSCASKVRSPVFVLHFQVTEWYLELDLSQLRNTACSIPCRLQRIRHIGPNAITLDIKVKVKLGKSEDPVFETSQSGRVFSETMENFWAFHIDIPVRPLESNESKLRCETAKDLVIEMEFGNASKTDPVYPKVFWSNAETEKSLLQDMRSLFEKGYYHDLVLKFEGEELKLHKCILAARWPNLVEALKFRSTSKEVETIEFSEIPPSLMKNFLGFVYFGDMDFMYHLSEIAEGSKVFNLVRKFNFHRLNDKITHLSPVCSSTQILQSYRTSMELRFSNVTARDKGIGDFRTCDVPLMPRLPPKPPTSMTPRELEKFNRHIRFLDLRVYVKKGRFGYNWLMFSVLLGKIPKANPVVIRCKLYVVDEADKQYLLTEQKLSIDKSNEITFSTPFSKGKISKRYQKVSKPVITWRELIDERMPFMRSRKPLTASSSKKPEEKDIYFRFELKLTDGEHTYDMRHGDCVLKTTHGDAEIYNDFELMYNEDRFANLELTAGDRSIKVQRAILAARSQALKAIIHENPTMKSFPINIHPDCLFLFIQYIYTGRILSVSADKLDHLITVAEEYKMKNLKKLLIESGPKAISEKSLMVH